MGEEMGRRMGIRIRCGEGQERWIDGKENQ